MENNTIQKKVETVEEFFIRFSDEEMKKLNISPGDKFSVKEVDNGILFEKYSTIEIDLSEFSREILETLIGKSIEQDISVNDVFSQILEQAIDKLEIDENIINKNE